MGNEIDPERSDDRPGGPNAVPEAATPRPGRRPPRSRARRPGPFLASLSVGCCLLLLLSSLPLSAASTPPNPPPPAGTPSSILDAVYRVSPSLYPAAAQLLSPSATSLVRLVALPSTVGSYGMINASSGGSGDGKLWYETGGYSPTLAVSFENPRCSGRNCSAGVPIQWNAPVEVTTLSQPLTSDALVLAGGDLVAAVSSGGTTRLFESSNLGSNWTAFGPTLVGAIASLSSNSTSVAAVVNASGAWSISVVSLGGAAQGPVTLTPTGTGELGIVAAAATFASGPTGSSVVVAFSVRGASEVEVTSSMNGGATYSAAVVIGTYVPGTSSPVLGSVGDTQLYPAGQVGGLVGITAVQGGLFLVYTSLAGSQVVLDVESSPGAGAAWQGPYASNAVSGTVEGLTVASSPANVVYAAWTDPEGGGGSVQEAAFYADGRTLVNHTPLPGSAGAGFVPTGGPGLAVDPFQRPLVAWPSSNGSVGSVSFTGAFLSANESLSLTDQMVMDPLTQGDFGGVISPPSQAAFNASVAQAVTAISTNLTMGRSCNAQNDSVLDLYSNLTHLPLNITPGAGTVCAAQLTPNGASSPIAPTIGADAPNTYLAVYSDWLLESLGVPLSASPLGLISNGTSALASLVPNLPQPITKSTSVYNQTETISFNPGVYSPTALDFSVVSYFLPYWYGQGAASCGRTGCPVGQLPSCWVTDQVSSTFANVTINNGVVKSFRGTTSYPSVYVTNLTPDQTYSWSETFTARYTETFLISNATSCTPPTGWPKATSPVTYIGSSTTLLSISSQSNYLNANFVTGSDAVTGTLRFDWTNSMGSTATATLTDESSGGQPIPWSDAAYSLGDSARFAFSGKVGDSFEAIYSSTSRAGGWSSAQQPAYSYLSYGQSPAQQASTSYWITLTRPSVTLSGFGVSDITTTTAHGSWYAPSSAVARLTDSLSGLDENQTITGIPGVELGNHTSWRFTVVLHGLEALSVYSLAGELSVSGSSYTDTVTQSLASFRTAPALSISESDLPYDSITRTGGGAMVYWTVPWSFEQQTPTPLVTTGLLTVWNGTTSFAVPLTGQEVNQEPGAPWYGFYDLTLNGLNATYSLTLELNFSTSPAVTAVSPVLTFVYQKDSSGDGLTDLEKEMGWNVANPGTGGLERVTADPFAYSTNGLSECSIFGTSPSTWVRTARTRPYRVTGSPRGGR